MRISTSIWSSMRGARAPQKEPVPFQEILPLKLKDSVSGKSEKTQAVSCLHEMSILFACFKNNDFSQSICANEIASFQKCHKEFLHKSRLEKEREQKGVISPGQKNLSHKQLNKVLKAFPNP